jgi:hypothetical protein
MMTITITTMGTMPKISSKPPMPPAVSPPQDYRRGADVVTSRNTIRPMPLPARAAPCSPDPPG